MHTCAHLLDSSFYRDNIEEEFSGTRSRVVKPAGRGALEDLFGGPAKDADPDGAV